MHDNKGAKVMQIDQIIQNHGKEAYGEADAGNRPFDLSTEAGPRSDRYNLFLWLARAIFVFALLYTSSYLALLWLKPNLGVEMGSQLTADYGPWVYLTFQPIDPAILEEIRQERGLPDQIIIDGSFWPTPTSTNAVPSNIGTQQPDFPITAEDPLSSPPLSASGLPSSPTASQPSYTSTPVPATEISRPQATATAPSTNVVSPTRPRKTPKTPKPHKTPKP
jgi:hypothetical protein